MYNKYTKLLYKVKLNQIKRVIKDLILELLHSVLQYFIPVLSLVVVFIYKKLLFPNFTI